MSTTRLRINARYGQYFIEGRNCDVGSPTPQGGNGLIWVTHGAAAIQTGLDTGDLPLTVTVTDQEPPLEADEWEEIVEVSMVIPGNGLAVYAPGDLPEAGVGLPAGEDETRAWRLRVHARGRDAGRDAEFIDADAGEEMVEEHAIQLWPAPPAPELRHRLTDQVGAEIRAQQQEPE